MKKRIFRLTAIFWVIPNLLHSQSDSMLTRQLDAVIISATKTDEHVLDVGRSVTVIGEEELHNGNYTSLAELLAAKAGVYIIGRDEVPGMTESIFLRGSDNNQTAIYIDGVRINDVSSPDAAPELSELSLSDISRIEIVRGSHSTMYGEAAIGGVIQIYTNAYRKTGWNIYADATGGTFGGKSRFTDEGADAGYAFASGWYAGLALRYKVSCGLDATLDTVTDPAAIKLFDNDDFDQLTTTVKTGYIKKDLNLYALYRRTGQTTGYDKSAYKYHDPYGPFPNTWYDGNNTLDFTRNLLGYGAEDKVNDHLRLRFSGGYSNTLRYVREDSTLLDPPTQTYDHTYFDGTNSGYQLTNELQCILQWPLMKFTAGAGQYGEHMNIQSFYYANGAYGLYESESDLDSLQIHTGIIHLFIQDDLDGSMIGNFWKGFRMLAGLRYDFDNAFGNALSFELNPSWRVHDNTLLYASCSTGYNPPSLYELYSPEPNYISGITRGNSALTPETSVSYEAGAKHAFGEQMFITASVYETVVDHSIEYVYLWDGNKPLDSIGQNYLEDDFRGDTYLNLGTQTVRGLELQFGARIAGIFTLGGNACFLHSELQYKPSDASTEQTGNNHVQLYNSGQFLDQDIHSDALVRRASTANIFLSYALKQRWNFRAGLRYTGSHYDVFYDYALGPYGALNASRIEEYALVDFTVTCKLTKQLVLDLSVKNIFNTSFTEVYGFTTLGRSAFLRLQYAM